MDKNRAGFSLVEVMLVLSIVFVLFVAMVGMVQESINRQRYKDAVVSLKDFFQRQYNEVQNVALDTGVQSVHSNCDNSTVRGINRGRTNCYVIGRLINLQVEDGASVAKVDQVVYQADETSEHHNSLVFNDFNLKEANIMTANFKTYGTEVDKYPVEWGGRLHLPGSPSSEILNNVSIFIFRSPETGSVRTHILPTGSASPTNLKNILNDSTLNNNLEMCVEAESGSVLKKRAVRISGGSSNASGVEIPPRGDNKAKGEVNCD